MIAWTREVPSSIAHCELTHLAREPIDVMVARVEHARYEEALRVAGLEVRRLPPRDDLPDSVFVEDSAVILDELAVIARSGAASRRAEVESVRAALAPHRPLASIVEPATLDGGDVLVLDHDVLVGLTERTNEAAVAQLGALLSPHDFRVRGVPITGCLHLKSAVTRAGPRTVVVNPAWIRAAEFAGWNVINVDPDEPFAANVLWLGAVTIVAEGYPRTRKRLTKSAGVELVAVPAGELAKAEGGVTCCSLLLRE
ncbi:MAG TPA: arginine deiminase family protein [Gemmatimonadaceae bacterium]